MICVRFWHNRKEGYQWPTIADQFYETEKQANKAIHNYDGYAKVMPNMTMTERKINHYKFPIKVSKTTIIAKRL